MVILFGTSTNKYDSFLNKRHKSTENSISNCATDKNCDNIGATIKEIEIFLLLRLLYLDEVSLQIKKEIPKFIAEKLPRKFRFSLFHDC